MDFVVAAQKIEAGVSLRFVKENGVEVEKLESREK